jgi:type IV secretory pathway VirJ component
VRRLFAILLFAATAAAARAECLARADVRDLPLVELQATQQKGDRFAIMVSGDGGWRRIDTKVTDKLRADGMPVVGFLANEYFRTRRTPDDCGCALERVIRYYRIKFRKPNVVLIGYSRGADVLPFMASRVPADLRPSVKLVALLGLEATIDFKYTPSWFFWHFKKEPQFAVKPELEKLRGNNILCVYGEKEKASLCHELEPGLAKIIREPGGHHFAGKYADVAEAIIAEAAAPAGRN